MGFIRKPFFWLAILIVIIIALGFSIFNFEPNLINISSPNKKFTSKSYKKPKPGSCQVLEQKYCSEGKLIEWEFQGIPRKLVGLRLPPNVPIFAPRDDTIRKTTVNQPSPFAGFMATLLALGRPVPSYAFYGDLRFESMIEQKAKKGDIIARTQDTGTKMFGDYSVVLWVSQTDPETKKAFTPEDLLKEMFPNIYSKPHKKASYEGEIKPSYINVFSDNPVPK